MKNKANYIDISDLIRRELQPVLKSECERLAIPDSFIAGIYGIYPKPFVRSSCCEPIDQDGRIQGARARIDSEIRNRPIALLHFWHEMRHAKDYYENRKASEWAAYAYELRRCLEQFMPWAKVPSAKRNLH